MLQRPGFEESVVAVWDVNNECMVDFTYDDGNRFFSDRRNLELMMNVDWFNPFSKGKYSLGVLYFIYQDINVSR